MHLYEAAIAEVKLTVKPQEEKVEAADTAKGKKDSKAKAAEDEKKPAEEEAPADAE